MSPGLHVLDAPALRGWAAVRTSQTDAGTVGSFRNQKTRLDPALGIVPS